MNDCEKPTDFERGLTQGLRDAAQILAIYPDDFPKHFHWILDSKRKEILAAAGNEEAKPTNPRRLGDGVTAEMVDGKELQLSVKNGDWRESASVIIMSKDTCEGLVRYIRQHVFCSEP